MPPSEIKPYCKPRDFKDDLSMWYQRTATKGKHQLHVRQYEVPTERTWIFQLALNGRSRRLGWAEMT